MPKIDAADINHSLALPVGARRAHTVSSISRNERSCYINADQGVRNDGSTLNELNIKWPNKDNTRDWPRRRFHLDIERSSKKAFG